MMELDSNDKELLRRAMKQLESANGVVQFLSNHFRDKYGLTPEHQVTPDGIIIGPTLPGLHGVQTSENGRIGASDDMRILQSEVALCGETSGDS